MPYWSLRAEYQPAGTATARIAVGSEAAGSLDRFVERCQSSWGLGSTFVITGCLNYQNVEPPYAPSRGAPQNWVPCKPGGTPSQPSLSCRAKLMFHAKDHDAREPQSFIRAHTALASPPLLPEITLHLATAMTPLWWATEAWLESKGIEPPYWAFAWAGGQAIARLLLDEPNLVHGRQVLDLAAGSGLCAIAAARAGAAQVIAVDRDGLAAHAITLNAQVNHVAVEARAEDIVSPDAMPSWVLDCDVVLAGDVCYDATMTAAFLPWLRARAASGTHVLIGDPGRHYLPSQGIQELARYLVPASDDVEAAKEVWSVVYEMRL
jgi:predicted nicotinamide N-methyase